uniref:Uncharacterized protein n=1 Tax=Moniliophthora roreri TaxID=221103 RepID=A0A0W0FEC2_MONRR
MWRNVPDDEKALWVKKANEKNEACTMKPPKEHIVENQENIGAWVSTALGQMIRDDWNQVGDVLFYVHALVPLPNREIRVEGVTVTAQKSRINFKVSDDLYSKYQESFLDPLHKFKKLKPIIIEHDKLQANNDTPSDVNPHEELQMGTSTALAESSDTIFPNAVAATSAGALEETQPAPSSILTVETVQPTAPVEQVAVDTVLCERQAKVQAEANKNISNSTGSNVDTVLYDIHVLENEETTSVQKDATMTLSTETASPDVEMDVIWATSDLIPHELYKYLVETIQEDATMTTSTETASPDIEMDVVQATSDLIPYELQTIQEDAAGTGSAETASVDIEMDINQAGSDMIPHKPSVQTVDDTTGNILESNSASDASIHNHELI